MAGKQSARENMSQGVAGWDGFCRAHKGNTAGATYVLVGSNAVMSDCQPTNLLALDMGCVYTARRES